MSKKKKGNPVKPKSVPADGNVKEPPAQPDTLPADALADGFLDSSSMPGTQRKSWFLTINHPLDHDPPFTHDYIKKVLTTVFETPVVYFCMANEVGLEKHTPHTHVLVCFEKVVRFRTVCDAFDKKANVGVARSICNCVDYIKKSGKWENNLKADTRVDMDFNMTGESSFEEWGERPPDTKGKRMDYAEAYDDLVAGESIPAILAKNKDFLLHVNSLTQAEALIRAKSAPAYRHVRAVYFDCTFSPRHPNADSILDFVNLRHDGSVYLATDPLYPWDNYDKEDAVVFLYYDGQCRAAAMLRYLDGHLRQLPARFHPKVPYFHFVYIVALDSIDGLCGLASNSARALESRMDATFIYKQGNFSLKCPVNVGDLDNDLQGLYHGTYALSTMFGEVTEVTP